MNILINQPAVPAVAVEHVPCPGCGNDVYDIIASGPDYENHCCDQDFSVACCRNCGLYYLNPRPTTEMLPVIYPPEGYVCYNFSQKSDSIIARARSWRNYHKVKPVLKHLRSDMANLRALDIGAGDGTLVRMLQSAGFRPENLTGVDIDHQSVQGLRNQGFKGVVARAEEMDFPASSFDLVTISHVIEHVADPRRVMTLVNRVLAPGGVFWLETPNIAGWDRHFFKKRTWGGYHFPRHWTFFTPKTIKRMLKETGFEVVEITTLSATFVWVWTINHFFQERGARKLANFFRLDNSLVVGLCWAFDMLPSLLGLSSNMRVIAVKNVG